MNPARSSARPTVATSAPLTADSIEIDAATSVRREEQTFSASGGKVRSTEDGEADGSADVSGPALVLS